MPPDGEGEPRRNNFAPEGTPWHKVSDADLTKSGLVRVKTGPFSYKIMNKAKYDRQQAREKRLRERPVKQKLKDYAKRKWREQQRKRKMGAGKPGRVRKPKRKSPKHCRHKHWRTVSRGFLYVRKYQVCQQCCKTVPVPG